MKKKEEEFQELSGEGCRLWTNRKKEKIRGDLWGETNNSGMKIGKKTEI